MVEMAAGAAANNRKCAQWRRTSQCTSPPRAAYLDRDHVCPKHLESEKDIFANKARNEGKPEKISRRSSGHGAKFYKDVCLVDQPFVRNPDISVAQLLPIRAKKSAERLKSAVSSRFQVGESASESEG
jgi:elongation factor Ts